MKNKTFDFLVERMSMIPEEELSQAQLDAIQALVKGPRGGLRGPFIPMLRSPEFMNRAQKLGEYLRYDSSIPNALREFAILVAAQHWQQNYEWHVHASIAEKAGVNSSWIDALGKTGEIKGLPSDFQVVYQFCRQLHQQSNVSDKIYGEALLLLKEKGVVELCGICGYYAMLAMLLNVARTAVPGNPNLPFSMPITK